MAAITWTDVSTYPNVPAKVATASAGAQTAILAYVNASDGMTGLDPDAYDGEGGATLNLARIYCAIHLALVGPWAGIKTGTREDDLGETWALLPIPAGDDPFWYTTRYGMAFNNLTKSSPGARIGFVS